MLLARRRNLYLPNVLGTLFVASPNPCFEGSWCRRGRAPERVSRQAFPSILKRARLSLSKRARLGCFERWSAALSGESNRPGGGFGPAHELDPADSPRNARRAFDRSSSSWQKYLGSDDPRRSACPR